MLARFGFKIIQLRSFLNANFTKNEASLFEITPEMIEGNKEISVKLSDSVKTIVFGNGSILRFSIPNENPGSVSFELGKIDGIDSENLKLMLFPGLHKLTNGSLESLVYTAEPGLDRSGWQHALHMRLVDPVNKTDRTKWIEGRVAPSAQMEGKFGGSDISRMPIELSLVGGEILSNGYAVILREGDPDSGVTL